LLNPGFGHTQAFDFGLNLGQQRAELIQQAQILPRPEFFGGVQGQVELPGAVGLNEHLTVWRHQMMALQQ
jgi:hypothetical protein